MTSSDGIQELTFLPMLEDGLDSLNVWIDQTALSLDDNRTIVDANDYSAGVHTLREWSLQVKKGPVLQRYHL